MRSSGGSSRTRATSRSRSARRTLQISPVRIPLCWSPVRRCSPRRLGRCPGRLDPMVALAAGCGLASSRRPGQHPARPRAAPGRPRGVGGCPGLRAMVRQRTAHRGGVGACGARRHRGGDLSLGERIPAPRSGDGEHLARPISVREPPAARVLWNLPGPELPAQRLRAVRRCRQCMGVDEHALGETPGAEVTPACCAPQHQVTEEERRVTKGGSHLCAPSYCHRYRPAARQGHTVRSTTSHVGFRCVVHA